MWMGCHCNTPTALLRKRNLAPIVQEAVRAPGPVWMGVENIAPTGIPSRTVNPAASRATD